MSSSIWVNLSHIGFVRYMFLNILKYLVFYIIPFTTIMAHNYKNLNHFDILQHCNINLKKSS